MARPVRDLFRERTAPKEAVILGKGPSLDSFGPHIRRLGEYVLGVNEVPSVIPCDGALYVDHLMDLQDYTYTTDIFRPMTCRTAHAGRGWYFYKLVVRELGDSWEHVIPNFGPGCGTMAVTLLGEWGVKKVTLHGFDSLNGTSRVNGRRYAQVLGHNCIGPCANFDYTAHANGVRRALQFYEMEWSFGGH